MQVEENTSVSDNLRQGVGISGYHWGARSHGFNGWNSERFVSTRQDERNGLP